MSAESTNHHRHSHHYDGHPATFEPWTSASYENSTESPTVEANNVTKTQLIDSLYYISLTPPMLLICLVSLVINLRIIMSVHWIRRPLSPTLHLSLSLAAADACTSALLGYGLLWNSLLPQLITMEENSSPCFELFLEAVRLGGVIVTVAHLLALTLNHYLGILKPLHYVSIMTHKNTTILVVILWTVPISFFLIYFASIPDDGFQNIQCEHRFLKYFKFRLVFAHMFFVPLIIMVAIYGHIFVIVRRHQAGRLRFSRAGSQHWTNDNHSGSNLTACQTKCPRRSQRSRATNCTSSERNRHRQHQEQQIKRNVKAIYTTLFIVGSFVIGWIPAIMVFCLICEDCLIDLKTINMKVFFFFAVFYNTLVILKTLANPIIYASRMQEIKSATRRMHIAFRNNRFCCLCHCCFGLADDFGAGDDSQWAGAGNTDTVGRLSTFGSSRRAKSNICRRSTNATPVSCVVQNERAPRRRFAGDDRDHDDTLTTLVGDSPNANGRRSWSSTRRIERELNTVL